MLGGNISNRTAPYIGFDIDSLLFSESKPTVTGMIMNLLLSEDQKRLKQPINTNFVATLDWVWNLDVSIVLVTRNFKNKKLLEDFLSDNYVPYTRVLLLDSTTSIRDFPYHYFFTNDSTLISIASSKHFMHIDDIWRVLK